MCGTKEYELSLVGHFPMQISLGKQHAEVNTTAEYSGKKRYGEMAIGCKEIDAGEEKLVFIPCFPRFGNITFSIQNCFYSYEFQHAKKDTFGKVLHSVWEFY